MWNPFSVSWWVKTAIPVGLHRASVLESFHLLTSKEFRWFSEMIIWGHALCFKKLSAMVDLHRGKPPRVIWLCQDINIINKHWLYYIWIISLVNYSATSSATRKSRYVCRSMNIWFGNQRLAICLLWSIPDLWQHPWRPFLFY